MQTLVTGGSGFVGKHLVTKLISNGEQVRILDQTVQTVQTQPNTAVDVIKGSVTNQDDAERACSNVESVFHLAGNAQLWARDPKLFDEVNYHGTLTMLEAAKRAGVKKFVQCSSLTTLVGIHTPLGPSSADETINIVPEDCIGEYSRSKRKADLAVLDAKDHMDVMIAMPTEPLGAGDESLTPPTAMMLDFINGKTPAFIDCILNFVPVSALADGFIAVRDKGLNGERYLLGGENLAMIDILSRLEEMTEKKMPTLKMPYSIAYMAGVLDTFIANRLTQKPPKAPINGVKLAGRQVRFSSEKARRELGWHASDTSTALGEMLDWAKQSGLIAP